ncbi:MAG: response regulator [Chloroflexota bacterium]
MLSDGIAKSRILLVEDDESLSQALSHLLTRQGWRVGCTSSGEAALEALAREPFDLVLLDVMLPGMDGFAVTRAIRSRERPGEHLPILIMTVKNSTGDRIAGLEAGADDYISKPFENDELLARIRAHLRSHRSQDHLRLESRHWMAVFESIGDGAFVIDPAGRVVRVNSGFCSLTGHSAQAALGKRLSALGLIAAEVEAQWLAQLAAPDPQTDIAPANIWSTAADGRALRVQASLSPLLIASPNTPAVTMGLGIWRDVTQAHQIDQTLRQQNRYLTALNAVIGATSGTLNLDDVLANALDTLLNVIGLERGLIHLWDETSQTLNLAAYRGAPQEHLQHLIRTTLGESLIGQAAQSGQPIVLSHQAAQNSRAAATITHTSGLEALAILPIHARERLLGTLSIGSLKPYVFSEIDLNLLSSVTHHLGMVIENARLYQQTDASLHQRVAELTALNEIGRTVSSILELNQLLHVTMAHIKDITQVEAGSLILVDEATAEMVFRVVLQEREAERLVGLRLPLGTGVVGHCIEHNEPILVPDVRQDERFFSGVDTLSGLATHSLLCVPLEHRGKVLGAIELLNKASGPFTIHDAEFLTSMAAFVSTAIDNAQLYAALRNHAFVLEKEVTNRTNELRAILNSVADGLIVTDSHDRVIMVNPAARQWLNIMEDSDLQEEKADIQWRAIQGLARVSDGERTVEIDIPVRQRKNHQACFDWFDCIADCPARRSPTEELACWLVPDTLCPQSHSGGFKGDMADYCLVCEFYQRQEKVTLQAHSAQIHDQDGQAIGEVTVLRDITRLKELDRLKSQFVSNVSHELKTPLGNLKLYLPLLEKGKPEKRERYLRILHQEVDLLEGLITDLLDLSRIETGRIQLDKKALDVGAVIQRVLTSLQLRAEKKQITLVHHVPSDLPKALADDSQIQRVITNLVTNAINYTPNGGQVTVNAGAWSQVEGNWQVSGCVPDPQQLSKEPSAGNWLVTCVSDTGRGISEADLPRLFERFFRGQAARSEVPGTGLGLSIVKEIMDLHGGHILIDSRVGQGSTFTVLLPLEETPDRPVVLIAEDEQDIHLALKGFLEWAGLAVDHAYDGQQALERITAHRPDLLLLDLNMPRLDGYQVIEALRSDEATADLPILVLTSWTHDRAQKALELGANEFLTKPFSGDVLVDVIRRMLGL